MPRPTHRESTAAVIHVFSRGNYKAPIFATEGAKAAFLIALKQAVTRCGWEVYAYAIMRDGATSKVVVLNGAAIGKIRAASSSAKSDYSPWSTHTDSMWLKSAVRQLRKWVPTSAEYIREQMRAVRDVAADLNRDKRIDWYSVESENFESIHNHSAYALIEKPVSRR